MPAAETVQVIVQYKQIPTAAQEDECSILARASTTGSHGQGMRTHDSGKRAARFGVGP